MAGRVTIGVLGAVRTVSADGTAVAVRGARTAALLARLVAAHPDPASVDTLIDDVWDETAGAAPLHMAISRLRALLAGAGAPDAIDLGPRGYRLALPADALDAGRFQLALDAARAATGAGHPADAAAHLRRALAEWRGPAYSGIDAPFAHQAAVRLEELRLSACEDLLDLRVAGGDRTVVEDLRDLIAAEPWRERPVALLARALFAGGRQVEALAVLADLRRRLRDEYGLDPSPEIAEVEWAILRRRGPVGLPALVAPAERAAWSVVVAAVGAAVPGVPSVVDVAGPEAAVDHFVATLAAALAGDGVTVIDARDTGEPDVAALGAGQVAAIVTGPGSGPGPRDLVRRAERSDAAVAIVRARGRAPRPADGSGIVTIRLAEDAALA
ncbi:MAG TPA: AfsR/SARP family transcriptional regulator [Acidimicrobiales bacterium]